MNKLERIKEVSKELKLHYLNINASKIIEDADLQDSSYQDMLLAILENELDLKNQKA